MELREAIRYALEGQAVLFAGSGFSFGAKNMRNMAFKTGIKLRDALAAECGIKNTEESLENVALLYKKKKSPSKLVNFLKEEFTLKEIDEPHKKIMSIKWKRVYTTNYDRVIERAAEENGHILSPVIVSDRIVDYDKSAVCVHINGFIDRLTVSNLDTEFKLTEKSYAHETLNGKPWFELMKADFRAAQAIIVVGFSMKSDVDIQRLLSSPEMQKKTVYVTAPDLDEVSLALLQEYGRCEEIGIGGLTQIIEEEQAKFVPTVGKMYFTSFIREFRETLQPENVELKDLVSLFYEGNFQTKLLQKDKSGEYQYLFLRKNLKYVTDNIKRKKIFVVISDLGNGKSIFCQLLRNELREKDIVVYTLNKRQINIESEIEYISEKENKHCVVIIDNYQSYTDVLKSFDLFGITNITFVLTIRKAIYHSYYRKLYNIFNIKDEEYKPVYLDVLTPPEIKDLAYLLEQNSINSSKIADSGLDTEKYINSICRGNLSAVLLDLLESSDIKNRYIKVYEKSREESQAVRKLAIFSLMKSTMNFEIDFTQMCELLDIDYVSLSREDSEYLNEIFNFQGNDVIVKSSVTANYFLYSVIDINEFVDILIEIANCADQFYECNETYKALLKNIVSHSHFRNFREKRKEAEIMRFYESVRNNSSYKHDPFFWEQFALACIDLNEFATAKQCIQNAFGEAKKIPNFVPFQIENVYGKYIMYKLLYEINKKKIIDKDDIITQLKAVDEHVMKYYNHTENNVYYVFKIGIKYKNIYDIYKDEFDTKQLAVFNGLINNMKVKMRNFISFNKDKNYIDITKKWLEDLTECQK